MLRASAKKPWTAAETTFNNTTTTINQSAAVMLLSRPLSCEQFFATPSRGLFCRKAPGAYTSSLCPVIWK